MAQIPYVHYPAIAVSDQQPFHDKVIGLLEIIRSLPRGDRLLGEIQDSKKNVGIAPFRPGTDAGNKCVAHKSQKFVRVRQAFGGLNVDFTLKDELTESLDKAEAAGYGRMFLAKQIVKGLTPATVRTVNNLAGPPLTKTRGQVADEAWAVAQVIEKLANGQLPGTQVPNGPPGQYGLADKLIRLLRPWLTPGSGSNSGIYFNPDGQQSCSGERGMQWRPPGIGLAHELCHAWRNATGNRLFDDAQACGLDDDEVMTTGIPPYTTERFSENMFRAVWPLTTWEKWRHWSNALPMRESYR
jgi:hypothetical protein